MYELLNALQFGLDEVTMLPGDMALLVNRVGLGLFFAISGYHKLFNSNRHASLVATLKQCGVPAIGFCQWFVPSVEFLGGLSLISGLLSPFASMGLICVCLVAVLTDGLKRITSYAPIDRADYVDDVLYLPEFLYIIGLSVVLTLGPGRFTLLDLVMP